MREYLMCVHIVHRGVVEREGKTYCVSAANEDQARAEAFACFAEECGPKGGPATHIHARTLDEQEDFDKFTNHPFLRWAPVREVMT